MDLDLRDELIPLDGGAPEKNGEAINANDTSISIPEPDPADSTPPALKPPNCEAPGRISETVCLIEGPVSASIRFITDEPASIYAQDTLVTATVLSEPWSTEHWIVVSNLKETPSVGLQLSDINENSTAISLRVAPGALPPVVITEIHADPLGPEPTQEFIELKNVGEHPVDLSAWMVDDNGDQNGDRLPDGTLLNPGSIGLIVSDSFDDASPLDPPPDPAANLIRIEGSIASNGLKNSDAESVELYDAEGNLVSRYDGTIPMGDEGTSLHRRLDIIPPLDPGAFGEVRAATPGYE